jgi:hypothetical protein
MKEVILNVGIAATMLGVAISNAAMSAAQSTKESIASRSVEVKTLEFSTMPVTIDAPGLATVDNRTVLTYSIINYTTDTLASVQIDAYVIASSGHIKGGEGWTVNAEFAAGSTTATTAVLKSQVDAGDRLILAVSRVTGRTAAYEVNISKLVCAVKVQASSGKDPVQNNEDQGETTSDFAGQTESFCDHALKNAQQSCTCGIASFSCSEKDQQYSFSCFQCTKANPAPNTE